MDFPVWTYRGSDLSSSVVTVLQHLRSVSRSDYPGLAGEFDEEEGEYDG